ncbi:MAG: dienelactone hydrolase [Rhodocyclales bacterium GT-UBC]|nr:MAG: dienelactone hydrolase [Rhodocyclales bacterium GT-UBC]
MGFPLKRLLLQLAALFAAPAALAAPAGLPRDMGEEVIMLPIRTGMFGVELETTLFRPPGPGPFPLVVINHGKASGNPRFQARARYFVGSREFVQRGYMVAVPMRIGFSKSGGSFVDTGCNTASNGSMQADQIAAVLDVLRQRPDVDPEHILLVGQSHGGLSVMAAANRHLPGVRGILNFAGGYNLKSQTCNWEQALVDAFGSFGKQAETPSLWFYGDNDSYWGSQLPKQMFERYTQAGGKAEMIAYGHFAEGDAHAMFYSPQGPAIWWQPTERFLKQIGLPTEVRYPYPFIPRPPKSDFAEIDAVDAVPYLDDRRREAYRKFLDLGLPRAFAIAPTGNVGWAHGGDDPLVSAVSNCEKYARTSCTLYAVDRDVVWPKAK